MMRVIQTMLLLCLSSGFVSCSDQRKERAPRDHLHKLYWALRIDAGESPYCARRLSDIDPSSTDLSLFVAPGSGHLPQDIKSIDAWADYIYFGNTLMDYDMDAPLLISPPENHGGKYGYVLCINMHILKVTSEDVLALIANPLLFAKGGDPAFRDEYRQRVVITVPERLKVVYSGKQAPK